MRFVSLFLCALAGLTLLSFTGCDSKQESARKKMISLMNDYADTLGDIKSNADFVDAKPKIEKVGAKMKDLLNEVKALPTPPADEEKKLDDKFEPETKKAEGRIQTEVERLSNLGVNPLEIMEAMKMDPSDMPH
jgi:hypothetical protein